MKLPLAAVTALVLAATAGTASAAPGKHGRWHDAGRVTPYERVAIQNARAHLAHVRARAWRDGHVTYLERYQIRLAEQRLERTIRRAHRS